MSMLTTQIRPLFRSIRDNLQFCYPPQLTPHGFYFKGSTKRFRSDPDEIGTIHAIKLLAPLLQQLINVGANLGYYCLLAESLGIPSIIGFEPHPYVFKRFTRNLRLNKSCVRAIPAALSDSNGSAQLYGSGTASSLLSGISGTPRWDSCFVTKIKMDSFFDALHPNDAVSDALWLLDCEGSEPDVLKGALHLLKSYHPILLIEFVPSRNMSSWNNCLAQLYYSGYTHILSCASLVSRTVQFSNLGPLHSTIVQSEGNLLVISLHHHSHIISQVSFLHEIIP